MTTQISIVKLTAEAAFYDEEQKENDGANAYSQ